MVYTNLQSGCFVSCRSEPVMLYVMLSIFTGITLSAVLALTFVWFRKPVWIVQSLIWLAFSSP